MGFAVWLLSAPATAQTPASCASELTFSGESAAAVVGALGADLPPGACAGAALAVESVGDGYRVRLTKGARSVEREVATLEDGVAWLESWLAVPQAVVESAPRDGDGETVAPPAMEPADAEAPRTFADPSTEPGSAEEVGQAEPEWMLAVLSDVAVDETAEPWIGADVGVLLHVSELVWLGADLGASVDLSTGNDDTERTILRASARGGVRLGVGGGDLRTGVGLGLVSATMSRETSDGAQQDDGGGPFLEALAEWTLPLGGAFGLVLGVEGRLYLVGAAIPEPGESLLPQGVPELHGAARVGLAWHTGGAR